jgi:adenylate kinase
MARLVAERAGDPALGGARRSSDVQILFVADPIAVDERRARDTSQTRKSTSSMIAVCRSEANVRGRLFSCSVASRSIIRLSPCSKMSARLPGW